MEDLNSQRSLETPGKPTDTVRPLPLPAYQLDERLVSFSLAQSPAPWSAQCPSLPSFLAQGLQRLYVTLKGAGSMAIPVIGIDGVHAMN